MSPKVKSREVALLLAPVAFLIGIGFLLRNRPEVAAEPKLKVSNIRFRRLPGPGSEGAGRITMKVYLTYNGNTYSGKGTNGQPNSGSVHLQNIRFVGQSGKALPLSSYGVGPASGEGDLHNYVLKLSGDIPQGHDITMHGFLEGTAVISTSTMPPKRLDIARFSWPVQLP